MHVYVYTYIYIYMINSARLERQEHPRGLPPGLREGLIIVGHFIYHYCLSIIIIIIVIIGYNLIRILL